MKVLEGTERDFQDKIVQNKVRLRTLVNQIAGIDKCLAVEPAENIGVFLSYVQRVEELGVNDINAHIQQNRYKTTVSSPVPNFIAQYSPSRLWNDLNDYIRDAKNTVMNERDAVKEELPDLEAKVRRLKIDRKTIEMGEDSIKLTKKSIRVSLWLPIITLFVGTILFEAFKPEITVWIRHLFGLASMP